MPWAFCIKRADHAVVPGTRRMPNREAHPINDSVIAVEGRLDMDRSLEHVRNRISKLNVNVILSSLPSMKRAITIRRRSAPPGRRRQSIGPGQ